MLVTVVVEEQVLLGESSSFDLANELVVPINSMVVVVVEVDEEVVPMGFKLVAMPLVLPTTMVVVVAMAVEYLAHPIIVATVVAKLLVIPTVVVTVTIDFVDSVAHSKVMVVEAHPTVVSVVITVAIILVVNSTVAFAFSFIFEEVHQIDLVAVAIVDCFAIDFVLAFVSNYPIDFAITAAYEDLTFDFITATVVIKVDLATYLLMEPYYRFLFGFAIGLIFNL